MEGRTRFRVLLKNRPDEVLEAESAEEVDGRHRFLVGAGCVAWFRNADVVGIREGEDESPIATLIKDLLGDPANTKDELVEQGS